MTESEKITEYSFYELLYSFSYITGSQNITITGSQKIASIN